MRRVMSIWFPELPLDLRRRMGDARLDGPFATIREVKNAWRLIDVSDKAKRQGLRSQMSLTDARAMCPDLLTEPCNPQREERLLRAIWRWSDKLSPSVSLDMPNGLFLDIAGCVHLFGDEQTMADIAHADLLQMSINARIGVCDTKRGAWAISHTSKDAISIAPKGETKSALENLPVSALNITPKITADLRRAGLKTIGSLYAFKTSELARRFGLELTNHLSYALGYSADPVSRQAADPVYSARMTLPDPIGFLDDVCEVVSRLATSVCGRLETDCKGARQFELIVRCVDTGDHELTVGFAKPCFKPAQVLQQLRPKLDGLKIEFGADWFRLTAKTIEPLKAEQLTMGRDASECDESAATQTLSTLGNRLGFDRVLKLAPRENHAPEREYALVEAVRLTDTAWPSDKRLRPERIFMQPEYMRILQEGRPPRRFEWRRHAYEASQIIGPERLSPSWWMSGDKRTRDYWIIQTQAGVTLWLLTYPTTDPPEWYVAGRFA